MRGIVICGYFTWDVLIGKLDGDVVVSGLGGQVLHGAASIAVILARHLCLGGALDGETESTLSRTARLHGELLGVVGVSSLEAGTVGLDAGRVTAGYSAHGEWRVRHRDTLVAHIKLVGT